MVELKSEQSVIQVLKQEENRLSTCLSANACMTNSCPDGNNPVKCLNELETIRNSIELVNQSIPAEGPKTMLGEYTVKSSKTPKR